ncbi:SNF2-related protein [Aminobacter sp. HY435]|uniref:SNF2-related protein n=1 Tax=Aminobacter sp. HY435 TaxID=2970917 RepID=UPI0022B9A00C|nr:SNF2-related protein [Aminobacter sp. HY435]
MKPLAAAGDPAWDSEQAGIKVRLRDNPGRQGLTTGRTRTAGTFLMVEVDFGPNEKQFKRYLQLEPVIEDVELIDLLSTGRFGSPGDLRRVLTFEKIKGDLTNVFYSMEASNTDFYPHQFKPVMRFIESPVGRMLIADEVGLGKTIEATYIWKEIQARHSARRLLIVCPAMLREKWRGDLRKRFNISAEIVSAKGLLDKVEDIAIRRTSDAFVCITSLEGLRPPSRFLEESQQGVRARFARLLDQNTASEDFAVFDHVIIDEAHYLRNPSTANNRLGRLLREASRHFLLLTATPIQIGSDNLYQLLRLVDEDEFYDSTLFQEMLSANSHIVRAQRALWQQPIDVKGARSAIVDAEQSDYFRKDAVLRRVKTEIDHAAIDPEKRIELLSLLESRSLLSQYMTRSRKREVLPNRVIRAPQVLNVTFSPQEMAIYEHVTKRLRDQSVGKSGVSLFSLVARQRQMASSIVGALESWKEKQLVDELLWEDFGLTRGLVQDGGGLGDDRDDDEADDAGVGPIAYGYSFDITELERSDVKYRALSSFLVSELAKNPNEKFVVFAFYRGTLKYLARRLRKDGIRAAVIMGAMGEAKDAAIEEFARPEGPSVLLSSEVGSEGIDLQFCRFVINYDLPWNPMRVEQRIGRLDRLGQKAERISIINLAVTNTIEDRILMRLYERINVFRESIGDMEEILGDVTEKLILDLLNPGLSDDERDRNAKVAELALHNTQKQQVELEQQAVNLIGFSDYVLEHISDSRSKGRWLSALELQLLVEDFFGRKYPGTKIEPHASIADSARIALSEEARRDLGYFIADTRPATRTKLHQTNRSVLCVFDPRETEAVGSDIEFVEPSHPLIQWIRSAYENDQTQLHRIAAMKLAGRGAGFPPGDYVFCAHRWSFAGVRTNETLAFSAIRLGDAEPLGGSSSEELIAFATRSAVPLPNAQNVVGDLQLVSEAAQTCDQSLADAFAERLATFEAENMVRCEQQETSANKFAQRRVDELRGRVQRFRQADNLRLIPMTEGLIRKEEEQLKTKLERIARRRHVEETMVPLAMGIIRVE